MTSCNFLCTGATSKKNKKSNMYSDSSSTTGSESEENYPGYISIPAPLLADGDNGSLYHGIGEDQAKLFQAYKGQLKISAYVNYGLLTVHVQQGRNIHSQYKTTCDSYIKLSLVPDDTRRTRCKTEVIHDTNNPLYDEKFSFELLPEDRAKRLLLSVWHRDTRRGQCEFLGCMSFGVQNIQSQQKSIHGWYYLLNGDLGRTKHLQVTDRKHLVHKHKHISSVNQDVLWMDTHVMTVKRGKSGFGFTINGSCPVSVCRVEPKSTAESSGVKAGDCVIRIDGLNVSRSTCESVARILKHCQKKVVLEIQRSKKVEALKMESLEQSPRRPLCSSTPASNYQTLPPRPISVSHYQSTHSFDPYSIDDTYIPHRHLETVMEESPPNSPGGGFDTQDYGWVDSQYGDEDIYVEPDEIRPQVLRLPQDPVRQFPPELPPNRPTGKIDDMIVSPFKPPSQMSYSEDDTYMQLDGYRRTRERDVDQSSNSRFEWDYSDTRLDDFPEDTYMYTEARWGKHGPPANCGGSSSGYSSSTLPRSMKFGKQKSKTVMWSDMEHDPSVTKGSSCDDLQLRRGTGAGAHGYQGERPHSRQENHYHRSVGNYHMDSATHRGNHGHHVISRDERSHGRHSRGERLSHGHHAHSRDERSSLYSLGSSDSSQSHVHQVTRDERSSLYSSGSSHGHSSSRLSSHRSSRLSTSSIGSHSRIETII